MTGGTGGTVLEVQDLEELLVEVLGSVFGEEAMPVWDAAPGEPLPATSRIGIEAAGKGTLVEVRVGQQLAQVLAGRMFGAAAPSTDDLLDAVGELGNILGGNVKTLLHAQARLSLPSSRLGDGFDPPPGDGADAGADLGADLGADVGAASGSDDVRARAVVLGQPAELVVRPGASLDGLEWPPVAQDDVMEVTR